MLHYLLQTLIFQVLFLALYDLFHKKDTFFSWNRLYLLITPILALILPFIKIEAFNTAASQIYVSRVEEIISISSQNLAEIGTTGSADNPTNWWLILYLVGAGISLFILILKFYKLNVMKAFSFTSTIKNKKIVTLPNSTQAFSFWNTIYLGDGLSEEEKKQILIHEIVHVDQKHSLDQLYFELLKVILWWNPLIYINQSRVTVLHEYLADAAVISSINKKNYIQQLLNATFQTQEVTFVNQFFNQSLIKKRIIMLQKSKSKSISKFKYLLLIPAITGILTYTSCSNASNQSANNQTESLKSNENMDISEHLKSGEPKCPNQNSEYDRNLDNYLKVSNGKNSEVILDFILTETSKKVRTVFIAANTTQFIRNIPEGKYKLHIAYGNDYAEKTVDGLCKAYFKNEKLKEVGNDVLDFNIVKTDRGLNVPSYNITLDLTDEDLKDHDHS
ncbi:M56 family metallopeptidase [Aquimarina sp. 2304DJ70-9]|uniref:M56 family metallopeptidase n=1 Tax=Aquimarina penaris TaxID=3231044 RepID=UPI003462D14E